MTGLTDEHDNPVLRGIERAKGLDYLPFGGALVGGTWLFSRGDLPGNMAGALLFTYAIVWLFANLSGAVLLITRNVKQTKREILSEQESPK